MMTQVHNRTDSTQMHPAFRAYGPVRAAFIAADDSESAEYSEIAEAMRQAHERVATTAARTPAEALVKARALWGEDGDACPDTDEVAGFLADLERLAETTAPAPAPAPAPSDTKARNATRPTLARELPLVSIDYLAGRIQTTAEQINQLMGVCEEAVQDMIGCGMSAEAKAQTWGRISCFVDLAQTLARETIDDGEAIEKLGASARLAAA